MKLHCTKRLGVDVNPITGEIEQWHYAEPGVHNKDNRCPHFKKRWLAKRKEKSFCIDCKFRVFIGSEPY